MARDTPWRDKATFKEYYYERGMTREEVADEFGCAPKTITEWRKKHDLPRKDYAKYFEDEPWHDPDLLHELYIEQKKSTVQIADELGCTPGPIRDRLQKYDIPIRSRSEAFKKKRPSFTMISGGYIQAADPGNRDLVYMHRLLAVAKYGFDAVCDNDVHHKNGIPWDNRPDNIEILSKSDHGKMHSREYWGATVD